MFAVNARRAIYLRINFKSFHHPCSERTNGKKISEYKRLIRFEQIERKLFILISIFINKTLKITCVSRM